MIALVVTVTLINVRDVGSFGNEASEFVHIGVLKGKIKEMKMRNQQRKYEITYLHALEIGPTYHRANEKCGRCGAAG